MATRAPARVGLLVAMGLGALALRPQLVGIGPLLDRIQDDLGVSHGVAGLLGTIPVLAMGLFAPFAVPLAARVSTARAVAVALALIALFGGLRAAAPGIALVLACTLPIGIGMALGNALMPLVVKQAFADRPLAASGGYTTGIHGGAAIAALVAVPLAQALGGWRASLAVLSLAACASVLAWVLFAQPRLGRGGMGAGVRPALPWRSLLAWRLVALFCLLSMYYYGIGAWLSAAFIERGWGEGEAGVLVAVFNFSAVPGGLFVVGFGERLGSRRRWMLATSVLLVVGAAGLILAPGAGFLWAFTAGAGNGMLFPLLMTLPIDVADQPGDVGAMTAMMLGVGYTVSAAAPVLLGVFRDATGSFTTSLWIAVALSVLFLANAAFMSRERVRRGIRPHRR